MKKYNLEDIQKYVAPKRQKRSTNGLSVMKVSKHAIYLSSNFVRATGLNLYKYVVMFAMSDNQIIIFMQFEPVEVSGRNGVLCTGIKQVSDAKDS